MFALLMFVYVYYATYFVIFKERFVCLNRHNLSYALFYTYGLTCKWPLSKNLGRCEVSEKDKKQYKLHEICQVKYITL